MRTIAEYQGLIRRLEAMASAQPLRYKCNVAALAALGLGFIALMLTAAIGAVVLVVALIVLSKNAILVKLALVPLAFAWLILRAMWIRIPPPDGRPITRAEAPRLFDEIERIGRQVNAQRVDQVVITPDFNAAVSQVPRLGLLGWPRNHLVLGTVLMASLSVEEFRAVLAHEFGHLARNHARFGNWIYRIRQIWARLLAILEQESSLATGIFRRFFAWYAPYFNAYSFVLARANEHEADQASVAVAGRDAAAAALVSVYAKAAYLDNHYWGKLWEGARETAEPPASPYSELMRRSKSVPEAVGKAYAKVALQAKSDLDDTHPSLAERLKAIGAAPKARFELAESAAEALLGPALRDVVAEHDREWQAAAADAWRARHEATAATRARLAELQTDSRARELSRDEAYEEARLSEALHGRLAAAALYRALAERVPDDAPVLFSYGRMLLAGGDADGVPLVEQAMAIDEAAQGPGAKLLFEFHRQRQDVAGMDRWNAVLESLAARREQARIELAKVRPGDPLEPHGQSDATTAALAELVAAQKVVKRAWLARRRLAAMPSLPGYVLVVEFVWSAYFSVAGDRRAAVVRGLLDGIALEGDGILVVRERSSGRKLADRIARIPGSLVFPAA